MIDKIILIVLDSVGIGELPDAANYSDEGSDTLGNIIRVMGSLEIPNLVNLGIGNIQNVKIPYFHHSPIGNYGKANEISKGKDTTTGHWEIADSFKSSISYLSKWISYGYHETLSPGNQQRTLEQTSFW